MINNTNKEIVKLKIRGQSINIKLALFTAFACKFIFLFCLLKGSIRIVGR